jgi:hypothetical protein
MPGTLSKQNLAGTKRQVTDGQDGNSIQNQVLGQCGRFVMIESGLAPISGLF